MTGPRNTPLSDRLLAKCEIIPPCNCWIWLGAQKGKGYGHIMVNGKSTLVHRISYQVFVAKIPDDMHVCHTCDNRLCINPEHLFVGTNQDNINDKLNKGRQPKGEVQSLAKLTESDIRNIRNSDLSLRKIAKAYGVSRGLIWQIKTTRLWKHVA